ncbi:hypothetical protein TNCT_257531 [Trichonephila clavata]|uniref:SMP-30/Gluconolactonase/LRE-like region domain-containing protein n=1 Tax=Trichonephila clavata TaxID=2740835 RepID=A0A8X6J0J1_TRICU|nr:hypothetical protein TNCT_257531 [Trichonephila clavata]
MGRIGSTHRTLPTFRPVTFDFIPKIKEPICEARKIYYFDYNLEDGSATNKRVLINYNEDTAFENLGYPDGMTIDIEGKLWVACYAGGCVLRIDPATSVYYFIYLILLSIERKC